MSPVSFWSGNTASPLIELHNVSCGYGDRVILDGLNSKLQRGKVLALIGTLSGGKATVLRLLSHRIQRRLGTDSVVPL